MPSKDQVLLSLTMHLKTGSSDVVDTLHRLGHGISYSETLFVEDKWAEWSQYQSNLILSNIISGVPKTLVLGNIDWKNKSIRGISNETHHTNCILIQDKEGQQLKQEKRPVTLNPNYNYNRKTHRFFKGMEINLPNNAAWKKSEPPKLSYNPDTRIKCEMKRSSKRTLVWAVPRKHSEKGEMIVPAWTGFQVLGQSKQPKEVSIGLMPALPAPPAQKNVIEEIINRAMSNKSELQLEYIFLEVDQAMYNKVLQVLLNQKTRDPSFCKKLIIRMVGFHIVLYLFKNNIQSLL